MSDTTHVVWRKSSSLNGDCVEVAFLNDGIAVRDSKDAGGAVLRFARREWYGFIAGAKDHELGQ